MHRILVDEKKWISESRFLHALNYCMLLPGPEAQQLATYIGWLLHRAAGGLVAGTLFILPGFVAILALSIIYFVWREAPLVEAAFFGLKPAVLAVVVQAVFRIGRRILKAKEFVAIAAASFVAIFFFDVPFPVILLAAALIGWMGHRIMPSRFIAGLEHATDDEIVQNSFSSRIDLRRAFAVLSICLVLWWGPLALIFLWAGPESVFFQLHVFFSKAAMVTFGGAYSVLAYVAQQAVESYRWLEPGEMLDGLGMAETTPGPLIMVVQFVGFLGASRHPGSLDPLAAGVLGAVLTTWVTFVPCFLWIFLGAPFVEQLRGIPGLSAALSAITAAVVGVVLNLAIWFAIHTLFTHVNTAWIGPLRLYQPLLSSLDWGGTTLAIISAILLFRFKRSMFEVLGIAVFLGICIRFAERVI